jgi:Mrp family chromosome partitioning ATPase
VTARDDNTTASPGLPIEPVTLLIGLIRRWKIFVAAVLLSAALGCIAAFTLGKRTFAAETILLYKVPEQKTEPGGLTPPVSTRVWMVKIPPNLRQVAEKLKLDMDPKNLADLFDVRVEKRTSLVFIKAQWDSPRMAADLANTLRDVFLANQMELLKSDAEKEMKELEVRLKKAENEYVRADSRLQDFIRENKIIDLAKEIQWNVDQIASLGLSLSSAQNERDILDLQKQNLVQRIENLKAKVVEEKSVATQGKSLADLNIRIERLRRAIHDNKEQRKNQVELEKDELAYQRAKELFEKGLIAKQDLEKARATYDEQHVKAVDTEQIEEWKRQLKVLEAEVIPEKESFRSPTQELLQSQQVKLLDMELQEVSLERKVGHVKAQIVTRKDRLDVLTNLQREQAALSKLAADKDSVRTDIQARLTRVRSEFDSEDSGFVVVSAARPPSQSIKSNRKVFFAVLLFLGTMIGGIVILASELLDTTIKSAAELQNKYPSPVIGVIPRIGPGQNLLPDESSFPLIETFRIIAHRLVRDVDKRGARILITSTDRWEGKTLVTANLAACLGRQDRRVLVMDAQVRSIPSETDLRYMIAERDKPLKGLGEWLSFEAHEWTDLVWPTVLPGVECLPRVEAAVTPDLLGTVRMKDLLDELSGHFSLVLIDGPSVSDLVDAELVAQWCDAVIFVVRSRSCTSSALKAAVERLENTGVPIGGFVLNTVDRLYLKWA